MPYIEVLVHHGNWCLSIAVPKPKKFLAVCSIWAILCSYILELDNTANLKIHNPDFQNEIYIVESRTVPLNWLRTTFKMVFGKELKLRECFRCFTMFPTWRNKGYLNSIGLRWKMGVRNNLHFLFGKYSFE